MPERDSVGSKVAAEHRELNARFAVVQAALAAPGGVPSAREAFEHLREALESHFSQEDHLYYPTIWALRPERKEALRSFVRAHDQFRTRLHELDLQLSNEAAAADTLAAFAEVFAKHEREEERLLEDLDREIQPES